MRIFILSVLSFMIWGCKQEANSISTKCEIPSLESEIIAFDFYEDAEFSTSYLNEDEIDGVKTGWADVKIDSANLNHLLKNGFNIVNSGNAVQTFCYFKDFDSKNSLNIKELYGISVFTYNDGYYFHHFFQKKGSYYIEDQNQKFKTTRNSMSIGVYNIMQMLINLDVKEYRVVAFRTNESADLPLNYFGGNERSVLKELKKGLASKT